jgi:hypothetical protein
MEDVRIRVSVEDPFEVISPPHLRLNGCGD